MPRPSRRSPWGRVARSIGRAAVVGIAANSAAAGFAAAGPEPAPAGARFTPAAEDQLGWWTDEERWAAEQAQGAAAPGPVTLVSDEQPGEPAEAAAPAEAEQPAAAAEDAAPPVTSDGAPEAVSRQAAPSGVALAGNETDLEWWKNDAEPAADADDSLRWWEAVGVNLGTRVANRQPGLLPAKEEAGSRDEVAAQDGFDEAGKAPYDYFAAMPRLTPINRIDVSLAPIPKAEDEEETGEPIVSGSAEEFFAGHGQVYLAPQSWPRQTPQASAYQFYSRPLWFEDPNLERCGHTHGCLQPAVSGAHFLGNAALIPYRSVAEPQCAPVPQKGFCPPGRQYSFRDNYLPPWSPAGAIAEGAAITGLIFLIP